MITAVDVLAYKEASLKEALMTTVRPVGNSVAFDKKIEPKDKAIQSRMSVGILPPAKKTTTPAGPMASLGR